MKYKPFIALIFSLSFSLLAQAQKLEKVKGNRNVTVGNTPIDAFHTIIVDDGFEIDIIYNIEPSIDIEADENLHEFIDFSVQDSVLSFNRTRRITSKKRLRIKVNYNAFLNRIETRDNGEILSLATIDLPHMSLKTAGNSKASLTVQSNTFDIESLDRSKLKLNITADSTKMVLSDNSKFEALIYTADLQADLYQRTSATIEGECGNLLLMADNNSYFKAKNFTVKTCSVTSEISSNITLEVTDTINISLAGSSELYLYDDPKIIIDKLADTSKLQKKVK